MGLSRSPGQGRVMVVREALWLLVLLLGAYAGWQFLSALRTRTSSAAPIVDQPAAASAPRPAPVSAADGTADGMSDGGINAAEAEEDDVDDVDYAPILRRDLVPPEAPAHRAAASPPATPSPSESFQLRLDNRRLQREVGELQQVVARQQDEIANLLADIDDLRARGDSTAAEPGISPEYSEALVLARQGLNVEMIATRCGITQAEAELVLSIAGAGEGRV